MAQPPPPDRPPARARAAGPNQWIKDQLDALIDARLLPEPPWAAPPAAGRARCAARAADRLRRAVAPDAATGRTP
jgi:hypothetical protein